MRATTVRCVRRVGTSRVPFQAVPVKTVLVAYDDPESQTLGRAADYAEQLGATLIAAEVWPAGNSS